MHYNIIIPKERGNYYKVQNFNKHNGQTITYRWEVKLVSQGKLHIQERLVASSGLSQNMYVDRRWIWELSIHRLSREATDHFEDEASQ